MNKNPYASKNPEPIAAWLRSIPARETAKPKYRKNSIEAKLDSLLPEFPLFDVIAHELWNDGDTLSVNDSWFLARHCDREEAIGHLANRWQVFKANYAPKARVRNLIDEGFVGEFPALLTVDCIAFAEIRNGEGK